MPLTRPLASAFAAVLLAFPVSGHQVSFPQQEAAPETQKRPDDSAQFELHAEFVLVNVIVQEGQKFAGGLKATDFRIAEDGTAQEIAFFGAESTPFAAAILLDTSGSMEHKLRLARVAAARFAEKARPADAVALFLFGSEVRKIQEFTPGGRDVADGIWDTTPRGITKMYDCISQAVEALAARPEQRRAILLLSDGADFGSGISYDAALKKALAAGITVYTIDVAPIGGTATLTGTEQLAARGILRGLADRSGGRFFVTRGGTDLNDAFVQIIDDISHQYTIGYYPTNSMRDGSFRRISVSTTRPGVKLRAREGYLAPKE